MPKHSGPPTSGQANTCDCLGCQIRAVIEANCPGDMFTPEAAGDAIKALLGNLVTIAFDNSSDPLEAGKQIVTLFGRAMIAHATKRGLVSSDGEPLH